MDEMRVTKVPAAFVMPKIKNVGVYCRVSTRSMEQLHSLASQVSHFTQLIRRRRDWKLYDFYIDIASGTDLDNRPEFRRMMNDCENGVVNTVITKSISRFGRNTEQALISLRLLTAYYVEVIFESEGVNTSESDSELVISIIEAFLKHMEISKAHTIHDDERGLRVLPPDVIQRLIHQIGLLFAGCAGQILITTIQPLREAPIDHVVPCIEPAYPSVGTLCE